MTVAQQLLEIGGILTWDVTKMELEKVIGQDDSKILVAACQHANAGVQKKIQPEHLVDFLLIGKDPMNIQDSIIDFLREFNSDEYWKNIFWDSNEIDDKVQDCRLLMIMA